MSPRHFFSFGYESPDDFCSNAAHGTDFESSSGFWIIDASEEKAVEWGRAVAQRYVAWLFERAGKHGYSWDENCFASWAETDPGVLRARRAANLPVVLVGETPLFEALSS